LEPIPLCGTVSLQVIEVAQVETNENWLLYIHKLLPILAGILPSNIKFMQAGVDVYSSVQLTTEHFCAKLVECK